MVSPESLLSLEGKVERGNAGLNFLHVLPE